MENSKQKIRAKKIIPESQILVIAKVKRKKLLN